MTDLSIVLLRFVVVVGDDEPPCLCASRAKLSALRPVGPEPVARIVRTPLVTSNARWTAAKCCVPKLMIVALGADKVFHTFPRQGQCFQVVHVTVVEE